MSQAGSVETAGSGPSPPDVPTEFITDNGTAVPILNQLEVLGDTNLAGVVPVETTGSGNTVTISVQLAQSNAFSSATTAGLATFDSTNFGVDANGFVTFTGGLAGIDSINVDASSIPGTDPVVPDGTGLVTMTGRQVPNLSVGAQVLRSNSIAANSLTYEIQQAGAVAAESTNYNGVAHFDSADFTVSNGFVSLAGAGAGQTITGDSGGALPPTAGNWNIVSTATNGIDTAGAGSTLTIGMASPYADASFAFARSAAGATNTLTVSNTSNTASSNALMQHTVAGTSAGDAFSTYTVTGATNWSLGVDNSDSDSWVLAASTALGTSNVLVATTAGSIVQTQVGASVALSYNCRNLDTNAASTSVVQAAVVNGSAADPFIQVAVEAVSNFAFGIDNSDADKFKICWDANSTTPSGTSYFTMTTVGEITMPLQPAFLGCKSSTTTNVTGNGTPYSYICNTEVFDQGNDYNNATGVFTAPVTGRYQLNTSVHITGCTVATIFNVFLATSNRSFQQYLLRPASASINISNMSIFADMDAGDTCYPIIAVSGEAGLTDDVAGDGSGLTSFGGFLAC